MFGYWIYISEAVSRLRSVEDGLIFLSAKSRNKKLGLTGYLHRVGWHYAQYLEGPVGNLEQIEARIRADWRHRDIRTLERGTRRARLFEGWDMAFAEITAPELGGAGEAGTFHAPLMQLDASGLIDMMADAIEDQHERCDLSPNVTVNRMPGKKGANAYDGASPALASKGTALTPRSRSA